MLLDRAVVDTINGFGDQDAVPARPVRWLGYPIASVTYRPAQRRHGVSKYSLGRMVELAVTGSRRTACGRCAFAIWLALGFVAVGAAASWCTRW